MNQVEKAGFVNELFNHIAPSYDRMNLIMTWGMLPFWQKRVMKETQIKPGGRGLDVCCGTGEMTLQLARRAGVYGEAVGLDFSPEMLTRARAKQAVQGPENVTFMTGDALQMPLPNNAFDAVTSGFALRNVTDIPLAIAEMARVCKGNGRVVCIDVSRPSFPPARLFFNWYYYKVVPWLGDRMVSADAVDGKFSAYAWLAESLRTFPSRRAICNMYRAAGLTDVRAISLGFGAVTIYVGRKPLPSEKLLPPASLPAKVLSAIAPLRIFLSWNKR